MEYYPAYTLHVQYIHLNAKKAYAKSSLIHTFCYAFQDCEFLDEKFGPINFPHWQHVLLWMGNPEVTQYNTAWKVVYDFVVYMR